jgi:acyl phosphate:glycerol-3-phosphate acyltransferase
MLFRMRRLGLAVSLGYLFGTIPSADIAARLASRRTGRVVDLRAEGSGNPGGTNAVRVLGPKYGYAVMGADIGKGAAAGVAGRLLAAGAGSHWAATASVVGHCFPVWNRFRGGKGVATSVGQCLSTFPIYFPVDLGVAAVTVSSPRWKQRAYAATAVSSVAWVLGGVVWRRKRWPNLWGPQPTITLPLANAVSSAVILYKFATATPPAVVTP